MLICNNCGCEFEGEGYEVEICPSCGSNSNRVKDKNEE